MNQALEYAKNQYKKVADYLKLIDVQKPIHIGETGWASFSMDFYGDEGSMACDEYKQGLYYQKMMEWSQQDKITIFFFEGFDEHWKDSQNPGGSENHFGLFALDGQAKFALWNEIDRGLFKGLNRDGHPIIKTFGGDKDKMLQFLKIKYKN
jgi:hypothetical protein